eukprot:TRINITY_DN7820_c0_g1_i1.p1 TRINITY_DN7820_c0_g1~~TRINITY_DN7820_c0_g1_i1.p1  ORF type:complete len:359 (-),score=119.46 TRINITY_DN7820_c0_g1_i1:205-1281(-)
MEDGSQTFMSNEKMKKKEPSTPELKVKIQSLPNNTSSTNITPEENSNSRVSQKHSSPQSVYDDQRVNFVKMRQLYKIIKLILKLQKTPYPFDVYKPFYNYFYHIQGFDMKTQREITKNIVEGKNNFQYIRYFNAFRFDLSIKNKEESRTDRTSSFYDKKLDLLNQCALFGTSFLDAEPFVNITPTQLLGLPPPIPKKPKNILKHPKKATKTQPLQELNEESNINDNNDIINNNNDNLKNNNENNENKNNENNNNDFDTKKDVIINENNNNKRLFKTFVKKTVKNIIKSSHNLGTISTAETNNFNHNTTNNNVLPSNTNIFKNLPKKGFVKNPVKKMVNPIKSFPIKEIPNVPTTEKEN